MTQRTWRGLVSAAWRLLAGRPGEVDYRRWYASWDLHRDYWTIVGPATKEEYERLGAAKLQLLLDLGLTPDARVLDVGCGTGQLTAALHPFLSDRGLYCGTDISPEAVAFCRARFARSNFVFLTSEMTALPLDSVSFDFVVFYSVFTHTFPEETALLLREARRLLAAGGVIFADLFAAPLVEQHAGGRGLVEVNPDHLLRLLDGSGLDADLVHAQPGSHLAQRLFFKFTHRSGAVSRAAP